MSRAAYPGANPNDTQFFEKKSARGTPSFVAFGMTKRAGSLGCPNDPGLASLLASALRRDLPSCARAGLSRASLAPRLPPTRGKPRLHLGFRRGDTLPRERRRWSIASTSFDGYKANPALCAGLRQGGLRCWRALGGAVRPPIGGHAPDEVRAIVRAVIASGIPARTARHPCP